MQTVEHELAQLRRPKLLVQAAQLASRGYERDRHLPRALNRHSTPTPNNAATELLRIERDLNEKRRRRANDYSTARHIDVLMALMCETAQVRDSVVRL